ncbi:MAG: SEC-C metal-binding domain-containing protein, partial [Gammaproteobacteria bacterium]
LNVVDFLSKDLSLHEFKALFQVGHDSEPEHWINGYLKAVELHEEQWREENDCHPKAGAALILLHSLINEELRQDLKIIQPGHEELREAPEMVTDLVHSIYHYIHGDLDSSFNFDDEPSLHVDELPSLPDYSEDTLASMDEQTLFDLVTSNNDRLPLEVVHACASRAEAMVPLLRQHLENDSNWGCEVNDGDWWGLLHAVFILGLIPGDASARALLEGFRRITFDRNNNLTDWLSSYWPALCRNKTSYTTDTMRQIAEDNQLDWYPRSHAVECVVADAGDRGLAQLEDAIDWLASLCIDESQDQEFRVMAGQTLLDHPRERHRKVMEQLVELQDPDSWLANSYNRNDIDRSFSRGGKPEWIRFDNPWRFYDPDEIEHRQQRWLKEDREQEQERYGLDDWRPVKTYVREQPKIGRNDPCPCGSGKKFKKCCMNKLH